VTFALGAAALQGPETEAEGLTVILSLTGSGMDLLVKAAGGILALRSLDAAIESSGAQREIDADFVARELRITLGQLPSAFGGLPKKLRVFGRGETTQRFVGEITSRAEAMGLKLELIERSSPAVYDKPVPAEIALSPALALAANYLRGADSGPELLPPKVNQWRQLMSSKFSSRKLAWIGGGAAGLALIVGGIFAIQQWQLVVWEAKWKAIEPRVTELTWDQKQSQRFSAWFDPSFRALRMLKTLTEAFPQEGSVSAKTLEIRDLATMTCAGVARDNQSYLRLLDQLRNKKDDISEVKTVAVHGQAPLQFTLNIQWEGGYSGEQ
jgi:hypothetical protein